MSTTALLMFSHFSLRFACFCLSATQTQSTNAIRPNILKCLEMINHELTMIKTTGGIGRQEDSDMNLDGMMWMWR